VELYLAKYTLRKRQKRRNCCTPNSPN